MRAVFTAGRKIIFSCEKCPVRADDYARETFGTAKDVFSFRKEGLIMLMHIARELENGRLLSRIVIAEALRIKAVNEEGADAEAYDAVHGGEISALRIRSFRLPRIEFQSENELSSFVRDTVDGGGIFFNDSGCYGYLRDCIAGCLDDFGCF